jgi:hypothetical protein
MNELIKNGTTWAEVIASFLLKKMHAEEEKYIKDRIKEVEVDCEKKDYFNNALIKITSMMAS